MILLINFIVAKGAEINIIIEKDYSKTAIAAKKNSYNITIKKNNKDNNKTRIIISANSKLTNLIEL